MHSRLTTEQAEASFIRPYREPTVEDIQGELEGTKLGSALLALLEQASEIARESDRKWADSIVALRQREFKPPPIEALAYKLIDMLGPHDDCYVTRAVAEREVQS